MRLLYDNLPWLFFFGVLGEVFESPYADGKSTPRLFLFGFFAFHVRFRVRR